MSSSVPLVDFASSQRESDDQLIATSPYVRPAGVSARTFVPSEFTRLIGPKDDVAYAITFPSDDQLGADPGTAHDAIVFVP